MARRLRRVIAEHRAISGILVGTWPELIELACRLYLVPESIDDNDSVFQSALAELEDAFWSRSLSVAPMETSDAVKAALVQVVSATDPTSEIDITGLEGVQERPRRHLDDLIRLARSLDGRLPSGLDMMRALLSADAEDALYPIRVYHTEGVPRLTRWQARLVEN